MILESRAGLAWLHAFCSYSSQGIEPIVYFLMSTWRASTVWKPPPHTQQRSAELRLFKVKGCSFFLSHPLFSIPALSIHAQPRLAKDTADVTFVQVYGTGPSTHHSSAPAPRWEASALIPGRLGVYPKWLVHPGRALCPLSSFQASSLCLGKAPTCNALSHWVKWSAAARKLAWGVGPTSVTCWRRRAGKEDNICIVRHWTRMDPPTPFTREPLSSSDTDNRSRDRDHGERER